MIPGVALNPKFLSIEALIIVLSLAEESPFSLLQENPLLGIFRDKPMKAVVRCLAIHNNQ